MLTGPMRKHSAYSENTLLQEEVHNHGYCRESTNLEQKLGVEGCLQCSITKDVACSF